MAVTRTLDRIRDGLSEVFDKRRAPDDKIEFDASLTTVTIHDEQDSPESCEVHAGIYIWASLRTPERGQYAQSTATILVPAFTIEEPDEVNEIATRLWECLQSSRVLSGLDMQE